MNILEKAIEEVLEVLKFHGLDYERGGNGWHTSRDGERVPLRLSIFNRKTRKTAVKIEVDLRVATILHAGKVVEWEQVNPEGIPTIIPIEPGCYEFNKPCRLVRIGMEEVAEEWKAEPNTLYTFGDQGKWVIETNDTLAMRTWWLSEPLEVV